MSNPYECSKTNSKGELSSGGLKRFLKHLFIYLILLFFANYNRIFGSPEEIEEGKRISFTASVITILLFYGVGYFVFSRIRPRR